MENIIKELEKIGMTTETYEQCLADIVDKLDGNLDVDWEELRDAYDIPYATDVLRKANGTLFGGYAVSKYYKEKYGNSGSLNFCDRLLELRKEKQKIQTEKLELNKNIRELARDELIVEHIKEAVSNLPSIDIPKRITTFEGEREYLLCFADAHYGIEFEIKDLFGNVINAYSPEIFEQRMNYLLSQVIVTIKREKIQRLSVWELGDAIQGMLRLNSQLMQLRYGVIESSILYAEYLANWLTELSKYVVISFQMVADSNHNQLRLCGAPKNAFPDENMSKVIMSFLKERLKANPNIIIIENPTGMVWDRIAGCSVLGIHGEVKNLKTAINDIQRAYKVPIDYIIAGHKHHAETAEVGIDAEAIHIRSVIGVDPFGMSLNRTSNAGASLFIFEEGKGKVCEYTYKLN